MIRVVCFLWQQHERVEARRAWFYTSGHVRVLRNMVGRNLSMPHEFVCLAEDPAVVPSDIRAIQLWDDYAELGGCYRRLKLFAPEMAALIGERFVALDLDCVITGPLDPLFDRPEDFVINSKERNQQHYNAAIMLMTAGSRRVVWDRFRGEESVNEVRAAARTRQARGSDQAWIRMVLGEGEARWTVVDGVHEARRLKGGALPPGARIVTFAGNRDPTQQRWRKCLWVQEHYR